ncbi:hypothetical protein JZ751_024227 [Albula glossodonta]|uniref:Uncharacterized protein n=1 Tax=Albula glossodonta TaxID=121402 RepID=A0A8T2NN38_9TELE|nr:hypothetical protein JZ751_024227 [Albula glossodonta]
MSFSTGRPNTACSAVVERRLHCDWGRSVVATASGASPVSATPSLRHSTRHNARRTGEKRGSYMPTTCCSGRRDKESSVGYSPAARPPEGPDSTAAV